MSLELLPEEKENGSRNKNGDTQAAGLHREVRSRSRGNNRKTLSGADADGSFGVNCRPGAKSNCPSIRYLDSPAGLLTVGTHRNGPSAACHSVYTLESLNDLASGDDMALDRVEAAPVDTPTKSIRELYNRVKESGSEVEKSITEG